MALFLSVLATMPLSSPPLAAFSVLDTSYGTGGLQARLGRGTKHPKNPLWGQTLPWETRIDNGYASVFHDETDPNGAWRMWYTTFTECATDRRDAAGRWVDCGGGGRWVAMLYANSSDGISWEKPLLDNGACYVPNQHTMEPRAKNHFDCKRKGALKTNIAFPGVIGNGMFKDTTTSDKSKLWKTLGGGVSAPGHTAFGNAGGVCAGPDGLTWPAENCFAADKIANMHWDTWFNIFADSKSKSLIATGRASNASNPCGDNFYPGCIPQPPTPPPPPAKTPCASFAAVTDAGRNVSDCAAYRAGRTPPHTICDTSLKRRCFGAGGNLGTKGTCSGKAVDGISEAACKAACSKAADCGVMQWEAYAPGYTEGQCWFYKSCGKFAPYAGGKLSAKLCIVAETCDRQQPQPQLQLEQLESFARPFEAAKPASRCDFDDCYYANRAISRVQTKGYDIKSLGAVGGGNLPVETGAFSALAGAGQANEQLYVQATFPYLNIYLGVVMVYHAAVYQQTVSCRLVWSNDTVHWNWVEESQDLVEKGAKGSFESHICYGSRPSVDPKTGVIREYYFGGDGPHYGVRNSSLALIEFRPHGLAGVGAAKDWITEVRGRTLPLLVSGPKLLLTADTAMPRWEHAGQGYVQDAGRIILSATDASSKTTTKCNITGKNVTESAVAGCDLAALVGKRAVFYLDITGGAMLYTIGFGS